MTEVSRPWSGTTTGDAGTYSAENWQNMFESIFGGKYHKHACIIPDSGTPGEIALDVVADSPASADVRLRVGAAIVNGTWYQNDAIKDITISSNSSGNPRIDTICLRWHSTNQTVRVYTVEGTPAASPSPPSLSDTSTIKEIPLADIAVANGFSSIASTDITPRAMPLSMSNAEFAVFQNNSGADIESYRIVELDTTNDRSIQKSDAILDTRGVTMGAIPDTEWGLICTRGIHLVYCDAAVTRGEAIIIASTAGVGEGVTHTNQPRVGTALETTTGAGFVLTLIETVTPMLLNSYIHQDTGYTTSSTTLVAIDATDMNETVKIRTGKARVLFAMGISENTTTVNAELELEVDSSTHHNTAWSMNRGGSTDYLPFVREYLVTGLSEGDHTFTMKWKTDTGTLNADFVSFTIQEIP